MASDLAASADHLQQKTSAYFKEGAALCDLIASKLDAIVTSIDGDLFSGEEKDLGIMSGASTLSNIHVLSNNHSYTCQQCLV